MNKIIKEQVEINTKINKGVTKHNVPFTEMEVTIDMGLVISIRQYTKNTWICYTDDRNDYSTGYDITDCWLAELTLFDKIPNVSLSLAKLLPRLFTHLKYVSLFPEDEIEVITYLWAERTNK